MRRNVNRIALALFVLTLMLTGCKSKMAVQVQNQEPTHDHKAIVAAYQAVSPDTMALQYISGNATLNLDVNGSNISLKGKLRVKRGEGIQITITPLGLVEAACVEFLPNKVRLINKLTKKYTEVPYSEAASIGLGGINYRVLEAIFLDYVFLPDGRIAYKGLDEMNIEEKSESYKLTTKKDTDMKYGFTIDKTNGCLVSMEGRSRTGGSIGCDYLRFAEIDGTMFPNSMDISFDGDTKIRLGIELSKTSNKSFDFSSRSISSSYRKQNAGEFLKSIK